MREPVTAEIGADGRSEVEPWQPGDEFPSSGQVRPSAAAAGRRTGPVLAPLRAAGPAAAHTKDSMTKDKTPQAPGLA
ncbi:MAG: hypothetical protein JOZ48_06850 [Acidobacteriaceae bacterium]|nr:hypothetical protein [Acidobacteriaceae bacterium]